MGFFRSMDISASALSAQRFRMDLISENIANIQTTRTAEGTPYVRKFTVFQERIESTPFKEHLSRAYAADAGTTPLTTGSGVRVIAVEEDSAPFRLEYDPDHPDAAEDGYVRYPNVEVVTEMVDMMSASRSYEAAITAMNTTKSMALKALEIGKI